MLLTPTLKAPQQLSSMASLHYQYTPLTSKSSLRLLRLTAESTLRPATEGIEVELFEVFFKDILAFEAVSYARDHVDAHITLLCNGRQLDISPVVSLMISTLSRISTIGVFWIVTVCIDPFSIPDKNTQEPRMRNIFSEAPRVWIWLDEGSYITKSALSFLIDLDAENVEDSLTDYGWKAFYNYQGGLQPCSIQVSAG